MRTSLASGLLASSLAACGVIEQPSAVTDDSLRAQGVFETTEAGAELGFDIEGTISITTDDEFTALTVRINDGLDADVETFPAHVHDRSCAEGGGGHYKIDPSVTETLEENEIWSAIEVRRGGKGRGETVVEHELRPDARSVVIHDPATRTKIACADIDLRSAIGFFSPLPGVTTAGASEIRGWASIRSRKNDADVWITISRGLAPRTIYPAHVHAGACADGGGGHYLLDPSKPAGEDNEMWPRVLARNNGSAYAHVDADISATLGAQSVVIHDPMTNAKMLCADLD